MRTHTPKPERRNANERGMPDLRRAAGISGDGCADAVRDLPQKGARQDALRKRALRVQRLPYAGLDSIVELCLRETACDPIAIVERMMALPSCHMHGPEHHVMVGAALLTAYHNAGGDIDLSDALMEMLRRGKSVPGGACGFWGACGAGISTGMFVSIISGSTPLTDEPFALSHKMTAAALGQIGEIGGPRCCKRDSFLSILTAIDFVKEHFGIALQKPEVVCRYAAQNNQCIGKRCPFSAANRTAK